MKRALILFALLIGLQNTQQLQAVEQSWAEKILNPKVALIGLGLFCAGSNYLWYNAYSAESKKKKKLETQMKHFQDVSRLKSLEKVQKFKDALPLQFKKNPMQLIIEYNKYERLEDELKKHNLFGSFDYEKGVWELHELKPDIKILEAQQPRVEITESKQINNPYREMLEQLKKYGVKIVVKDTSNAKESTEIRNLMKKLGYPRESLSQSRANNTYINDPNKPLKL